MQKILTIILMLSLSACTSSVQINDTNVYDNINVTRGSNVFGNVFFKSDSNKPLGECLTNLSSCTRKQLTLGDKIDAQYYRVTIYGSNVNISYPSDKLLTAAAMAALQEEFKYISPLSQYTQYYSIATPQTNTNCYMNRYGGNCNTYTYSNVSSTTIYMLDFFAYNNYEDVTNGVLISKNTDNQGDVLTHLYFTDEYLASIDTLSSYKETPNSVKQVIHTPYANAWKTKYDALEIFLGEQVEMKQFDFNDERISTHTYIKDKYAQD